jgi:DNA-binding GntR family transcriptional regulator
MKSKRIQSRPIKLARGNVKPRVVRHEVRDEIQRRILSGESKPGERLSQQSLARELGVAQGTVRESLLELQWLGLVESVDHLGVFVEKFDAAKIGEAYLLREVMEGLAARLSCRTASRSDISELREMAERIYKLAQAGDGETASLDRSFHLRITEMTRNDTLLRLSRTYRALGMIVRAFREPSVIYAEHTGIIDAIENNLAEEAERRARMHVLGARETIEAQAQSGNFVPQWVK